jgi:hypothetical protein
MSLWLVELGIALLNAGAQHWRNMSSDQGDRHSRSRVSALSSLREMSIGDPLNRPRVVRQSNLSAAPTTASAGARRRSAVQPTPGVQSANCNAWRGHYSFDA